jgi:hypothetical protein
MGSVVVAKEDFEVPQREYPPVPQTEERDTLLGV